MMMMIRTRIQLTERQVRLLRALAVERQTSIAELIRQGVDRFVLSSGADIETRRQRAIVAADRFRSGCPDFSSRHDQYLAEAYDQ